MSIAFIAILLAAVQSARAQTCSGTRSSIGCALISDADICAEAKCNSENGGCVENPVNPPCSAITVERACTAVRCTWGSPATTTTTTTTTTGAAAITTTTSSGPTATNADGTEVSGVIVGAVIGANLVIMIIVGVVVFTLKSRRESNLSRSRIAASPLYS